ASQPGDAHAGKGRRLAEAPKSVFQQGVSDVDPENAPQKPPGGRSPPQPTIRTIPKTLPKEARYFAGFLGLKIAAFLKIRD
ncbi:MAG: hypothetical protein WC367_06680, partial [Methanoregula sp.]